MQLCFSPVQVFNILNPDRFVILGFQVQRPGFQPQVNIFGYQYDPLFGIFIFKMKCGVYDVMIIFIRPKNLGGIRFVTMTIADDPQFAVRAAVERNPVLQ